MCLVLSHLKPKIADKDIICYKFVDRTKIKGIYKSGFKKFEYIIRRLYTNNISIEFSDRVIKPSKTHYKRYYIEEDMFHSYMTLSYSLQKSIQLLYKNRVILKCIIPKGAYYYIGMCGSNLSYASSQIKILEEI